MCPFYCCLILMNATSIHILVYIVSINYKLNTHTQTHIQSCVDGVQYSMNNGDYEKVRPQCMQYRGKACLQGTPTVLMQRKSLHASSSFLHSYWATVHTAMSSMHQEIGLLSKSCLVVKVSSCLYVACGWSRSFEGVTLACRVILFTLM